MGGEVQELFGRRTVSLFDSLDSGGEGLEERDEAGR